MTVRWTALEKSSIDSRLRTRGFMLSMLINYPPAGLARCTPCKCGIQKATGTWLLFTDADVHFTGGTLRRAVAFALNQGCDHLALIPLTLESGFWLDVVVRTFGLLFFVTTRAGSANRPSSKTFVGIGAFNLVRAQTLCRTQGFEWLRLEPADDLGLALMIKLAGGVSRLAIAYENLTVEWYPTVGAMFKGLEKNLFGPACYPSRGSLRSRRRSVDGARMGFTATVFACAVEWIKRGRSTWNLFTRC